MTESAAPAAAPAAAAPTIDNSTTTASAPFAAGNGQQQGGGDFREMLGDLKDDPMFKDFKDIKGMAQAYRDTKALVGKKFAPPGADATPEQKAEFYKTLGVPETKDGYELAAPEDLPEELKGMYETEMLDKFAEAAKNMNLTPEQAKGLQKWYDDLAVEMLKGTTDAGAQADQYYDKVMRETYKDEAGVSAALGRASGAVEKYVPQEVRELLDQGHAGAYYAALTMALDGQYKELTGEDALVGGEAAGQSSDPAALRKEAQEIMKSEEYQNPFSKGKEAHEAARKKVRELYQRIGQTQPGKK